MADVMSWIEQTLHPRLCTTDEFYYDEMESQSGYSLPVIYEPFDGSKKSHWQDRGYMFDFLMATRGEDKRLLDFGPGDGWPSLIVAPLAGEVVGVDGSGRRVAVCTANAARLGHANARFIHAPPGSRLPFPDDTFDGVMAASSVEQTPDPRATLGELLRVLKPGGRLRITYENLAVYRGGRERETWLARLDDKSCALTLYDRYIDQEYARMVHLVFSLPRPEVLRTFGSDGQSLSWEQVTVSALQELLPAVVDARACTLKHPSGETFARWMRETGFRQVCATHSGGWFAGRLFEQLPAAERPRDIHAIDALLRPLVEIVICMHAPLRNEAGWDPMITAVK